MSDDSGKEKNEKPTDKKIRDARDKGQIAVSKNLASVTVLTVVAELAFASESLWREAIQSLMNLGVTRIGQPFRPAMMEMASSAGILLLLIFGATFIVCSVTALFAYWGQFGVLIAPEVLEPKLDKLNPVEGMKQLFSKKKLGELLLSIVKAVLIGLVIFLLARDQLGNILKLSGGVPKDVYFGFITILRDIFHVVIILCVFLAVLDFAMQKYFHLKSLNMDLEEIKKEQKETEGDPLIKNARKNLARSLAMEGPADKTQGANALVVNPTHFAVAMLYDATTPVPVVLAKGKDDIAQAMIQRAREHGIPVIRHVWLARTLYATCRTDSVIPKASYEAVAHVYAVVQELREAHQTERDVELESYGDPPESHLSHKD